ncbi:MAG: YbaB/EbfC family nucleoid-associated protein [Candidatus Eremiobacteraeota bacterium]|nr:YbaB/EbfC family nucleoid-associated protein [Candidatus Eremiobacteraeota bacterium]
MMNQAQMLAQMRKMQAEMTKAQEELASTVVSGHAGGDAVTVDMTCDFRVTALRIAKEAIDPDDPETLEDLLTVAFNDALGKVQETSNKRMSSVTGGVRVPGL